MFACVDVGYDDATATAACVAFERWEDACASDEYMLGISDVQPYVPGQFYQRELPCVLAVLQSLPTRPDLVVIDGYVWLDDSDRRGLGGHLFESLGQAVPVIGVAKTRFATANGAVEVFRGSSRRPLLVTAVGIGQGEAADCISRMHGDNRIPTLLRRVDQLSRVLAAPVPTPIEALLRGGQFDP